MVYRLTDITDKMEKTNQNNIHASNIGSIVNFSNDPIVGEPLYFSIMGDCNENVSCEQENLVLYVTDYDYHTVPGLLYIYTLDDIYVFEAETFC